MPWQGLAAGTATLESRHCGLRYRYGGICLCPILPKVRFQILELRPLGLPVKGGR